MQQVGFWIVTTVAGLMIGALGWFVKRTVSEMEGLVGRSDAANKERFLSIEKRAEKQGERYDAMVSDLPTKYAMRDDLIRMNRNIESRLDKIQDLIMDLKGR